MNLRNVQLDRRNLPLNSKFGQKIPPYVEKTSSRWSLLILEVKKVSYFHLNLKAVSKVKLTFFRPPLAPAAGFGTPVVAVGTGAAGAGSGVLQVWSLTKFFLLAF